MPFDNPAFPRGPFFNREYLIIAYSLPGAPGRRPRASAKLEAKLAFSLGADFDSRKTRLVSPTRKQIVGEDAFQRVLSEHPRQTCAGGADKSAGLDARQP